MKRDYVVITWLAMLLILPALTGTISPVTLETGYTLPMDNAALAQFSEGEGVIPMDLSVMVGDSGIDLVNAFAYLAAVPFAIRSNSTHTASGLILPDDIESYASPLGDWIEFLGGSINEVVFLGDVQNPQHTALSSVTDSLTLIEGVDHFELAANLAQEFFVGASSVVLVRAPLANQFSDEIVLVNTRQTLSAMSTTTRSGSTSSNSDWEYFGSYSPTGGGAIITVTGVDEYIWFEILDQQGSNYYPLDYPYYDLRTVMYPYDEVTNWILHAIDFYPYDRYVSLNFNVEIPDADFFEFSVAPGEDCEIEFDLVVDAGMTRDIGLNVLDPEGNIILTGNRLALFEDIEEVNSISVSLSHPAPGTYRAYVFNAEHVPTTYDLDIVKHVINPDYEAATAGAANGAALASLLGVPLLYAEEGALGPATEEAIEALSPSHVYYVNPTGDTDYRIEDELDDFGITYTRYQNFTHVQSKMAELDERVFSTGSVILYDSIGTSFAAAGLSAAHRKSPAIPYSFADSELMTLSQIPEQTNWNREYQFPLASTVTFLDVWTSYWDFSAMNPPPAQMISISTRFFSWLSQQVGIENVRDVITIAPFKGPGEALPPTFERAITGKAAAGRYSSIDTDATLVQIMRSVLRIPLQSLASRSKEVLGSYLVYSYNDQVMDNSRSYTAVDNSNFFNSMVISAGLTPVMQVGPSTISEVQDAPYAWVATVHGGIGTDLYNHDGRLALFYTDTWRGYDAGYSPEFPDGDSDESPAFVVNPPEYYMDIYNMSDIVGGSNLRGMFALLDACQLGSSYAPSTMMESGADAVVACRTDTLVGPADLFEYNVLDAMTRDHDRLKDAIESAFDVNSHRYSFSDLGLDSYVSSSDAAIIGASCIQFIIFGDPDISLYDCNATPHAIVERCVSVGPSTTQRAHPGSTYRLPLGVCDPVGHMFAEEGTYNIVVYDPDDSILTSGVAICTIQEIGGFDIHFDSTAQLGLYIVEITDVESNSTFYSQIVLDWPQLVVEHVYTSTQSELGVWHIVVAVTNPHDAPAETTVQVSLDDEVLLTADATWQPGYSENTFEVVMVFGHSGQETLSIIITMGTQAYECCNYESLIVIRSHWVTPMLWILIPALSVCVVISGLYTRKMAGTIGSLQEGLEAEIAGDHETAFDLYCTRGMVRAATRITVKEDFPEEMMTKLLQCFTYENVVYENIHKIVNSSVQNGNYRTASKVYFVLGQETPGHLYKAMAGIEDDDVAEVVNSFSNVLALNSPGYAMEIITSLLTKDEAFRTEFVGQATEDIYTLGSKIRGNSSHQEQLLALIEDHFNDENLIKLNMSLGRVSDVAEKILAQQTIPKMVKLTKMLDASEQISLAPFIVDSLSQSHKPSQVAKYITSIDIDDRAKEMVVAPMIRQLIDQPTDKTRVKALQSISQSSSTGSLRTIDNALDSLKTLISTAEEMGVAAEHMRSTALVPVIAGMKDRSLAEKLLLQTEQQVMQGSVPASADLGALAQYVYSLRSATYIYDDVLPPIRIRLDSYQGTLENRLSKAIQESYLQCKFRAGEDDWLETSSDEIAEHIVSTLPVDDSISMIKGCFIAVSYISSQYVSQYLENSIGREKQLELANRLMEDPLERDRILRRHLKLEVNELGQSKWVPDQEAAYADALKQVLEKWKPEAASAVKLGMLKAAMKIAHKALEATIPAKELYEISIHYIYGIRTYSSPEKNYVLDYLQKLKKQFTRDEIATIIQEARVSPTILETLYGE